MNDNIGNTVQNLIEKSCNDITKNIINEIKSPLERVIKENIMNGAADNILPDNTIKTSYIIGGYELSSPVFIFLLIVLIIVVLYVLYKLFNYFFPSSKNEFVSVKKYKNKRKNNQDSENSSYETDNTIDVSNTEKNSSQ